MQTYLEIAGEVFAAFANNQSVNVPRSITTLDCDVGVRSLVESSVEDGL
jgi:hypothetical protein